MKKFIIFFIQIYQNTLSAYTPSCRYSPSCSQYMIDAVKKNGIIQGGLQGISRCMSCHPLSRRSPWDPVE